jgi:peptidoglycan/xylan/chitin deacetylase (PgdA/CDA1 family)
MLLGLRQMIRLFLGLAAALFFTVTAAAQEFMLTFDDGPLPGATDKVLRTLENIYAEDGTPVKAGFFLVGDTPKNFWESRKYFAPYELWGKKGSIADHPELVRQILAAGHLVGNHTTHHSWFRWPWLASTEQIEGEITAWEKLAQPLVDPNAPRLFRPPYLVNTAAVREAAAHTGYQLVLGTSSGDAAPFATPYSIVQGVAATLEKWDQSVPCTLIFHDTRTATQEHLADIVSALRARGFRLVHFDPARAAQP